MDLGERRFHRSIGLGRCRWLRETPRRNVPAKAGATEREEESPEGKIPRALHSEIWVGGGMGRKTPREWKLRRRKVPGEESPGKPDPFHRKRCRERNPRRGTVGSRERAGKAAFRSDPGGERRPREDGGGILTNTAGAAGSGTPDGPRLARDAKVVRGAVNQWTATHPVSNTPKVT